MPGVSTSARCVSRTMPGVSTSARILYIVATADDPMTAREIADVCEVPASSVSGALTRLHRAGLVVRRKRETAGRGGDPYEYALAAPEVAQADE